MLLPSRQVVCCKQKMFANAYVIETLFSCKILDDVLHKGDDNLLNADLKYSVYLTCIWNRYSLS